MKDFATIEYGEIRADLEKMEHLGPLDALIAAHVKSQKLTIVTSNEKEFIRTPDFKIEDRVKK